MAFSTLRASRILRNVHLAQTDRLLGNESELARLRGIELLRVRQGLGELQAALASAALERGIVWLEAMALRLEELQAETSELVAALADAIDGLAGDDRDHHEDALRRLLLCIDALEDTQSKLEGYVDDDCAAFDAELEEMNDAIRSRVLGRIRGHFNHFTSRLKSLAERAGARATKLQELVDELQGEDEDAEADGGPQADPLGADGPQMRAGERAPE